MQDNHGYYSQVPQSGSDDFIIFSLFFAGLGAF